MEELFTQTTNLAISVLGSVVAFYLTNRKWILLPLTQSLRTKRYLRDLGYRVKSMPFIYRDLEANVMTDFVDVEVSTLNLSTLKIMPNTRLSTLPEDKLKNVKKVIFLGNPGIGKTTYQRHSILSLIHDSKDAFFKHERERLIPFYVPLKVLQNTQSEPIYRYIIKNSKPLKYNDILNITENGELFLLLDGYDEIASATVGKHERNYILEELDIIFSQNNAYDTKNIFYNHLKNCRVWLSSRREFFELNPINLHRNDISKGQSLDYKFVELTGIARNRIYIIKNIFDKYRRRNPKFNEVLNEEYFIIQIDKTKDHELISLSYNPLFLTVMTYIYASNVIECNTCDVTWSSTFYELILRCIKLLLKDLDEEKARDLPDAYRKALMLRRNAYYEEKIEFLKYFSLHLFLENRTLFDFEYLLETARCFFRNSNESPKNQEIINELDEIDANYPNLPLQLIYSGVFIVIDKTNDYMLYDLPHRRFREVLACEFINTPEKYELFLAHIHESHMSELAKVFYQSPVYNIESLRNETIRNTFRNCIINYDPKYYVTVTNNFFKNNLQTKYTETIIEDFLLNAIKNSEIKFKLSISIIEQYKTNDEFLELVHNNLNEAITRNEPKRFSLCCALIAYYNSQDLYGLLITYLNAKDNILISTTLLQYVGYLKSNTGKFDILKERILEHHNFIYFCYALVMYYSNQDNNLLKAIKNINIFSTEKFIYLFYFIFRFNRKQYSSISACIPSHNIDDIVYDCAQAVLSRKNDDIVNCCQYPDDIFFIYDATIESFNSFQFPEYISEYATRKVKFEDYDIDESYKIYWKFNANDMKESILKELYALKYKLYYNISDLENDLRKALYYPLHNYFGELKKCKPDISKPNKASYSLDDLTMDEWAKKIDTITNIHIEIDAVTFRAVLNCIQTIENEFIEIPLYSFFE